MKARLYPALLIGFVVPVAVAQVPSHSPTSTVNLMTTPKTATAGGVTLDKPVARVNGSVLTGRDLLREMYAIFPYARQHNGFPKQLEPEIRKGALEMIIFEELVYQEAKQRHLTIPTARLAGAEAQFRNRFPDQATYEEFLKTELHGSKKELQEKIRRSLTIEEFIKAEVGAKSFVSESEAKAYYDKNPQNFEHGESFSIQTISIIPPANVSAEVQKEARKRADEALRQAKATRSYAEFGLLAEKISDDDWRVNMGDRKQVDRSQLPPPLVAAALKMKLGDVSDLIQLGTNYTLFRLNGHTPAGKVEFAAVKTQIQADLQKVRYNDLRVELDKRLRKAAKVEVL